MGRRKLKFVLPRLNDCGGNMNASWYVEYSYRDERTDKLERFRVYEGFASITTKEGRYTHADRIITDISGKIAKGWTPFSVHIVEIDNAIMYHNQTKVYNTREKTEKNLFYYSNLFLGEKIPQLSLKSGLDYKSKIRLFFQWLDVQGKNEIYAHEVFFSSYL